MGGLRKYLENGKSGGVGGSFVKFPPWWGYGYFLEPHIFDFKFPGRRHIGFYDAYGCHYCYSAEVLLCETIEQPYNVMKSKMVAPRKFKMKNGR